MAVTAKDAVKLEAAEQDAMRRFYRANSNFFTQVVVKKKAIRAAMLKNQEDFPGIKAPETAPPAPSPPSDRTKCLLVGGNRRLRRRPPCR